MEIADKTFLIDAETRVINIPDGEEHLGVEGDVGTGHKYFKCPRIVGDDGIDLNEHQIYISYAKTNTAKATRFVGDPALYHCNDVALDETGDYVTFSWEMSGDVFKTQGLIAFKVMAKKTDGESVKTCWNTRPAIGTVCMTVPDGIEGIAELYPDIITQLLDRMDAVEEIATVEAMQGYVDDYLGRNPVQLDSTLTDPEKAAPADVVGELRGDLADLENKSLSNETKAINKTTLFTLNGYLNKEGVFVSGSSQLCTDFIKAKQGDVFYLYVAQDDDYSLPIAIYDMNKNFIKGVENKGKTYVLRYLEYEVEEDCLIRISSVVSQNSLIYKKEHKNNSNVFDSIKNNFGELETYYEDMTQFVLDNGEDNKRIDSWGDIFDHDDGFISDYIKVEEGDIIKASSFVQYNNPVLILYYGTKQVNKVYGTEEGYQTVEVTIPPMVECVRISSLKKSAGIEFGILKNKTVVEMLDEKTTITYDIPNTHEEMVFENVTNGYIKTDGTIQSESSYTTTDYIDLDVYDWFHIVSDYAWNACGYVVFDKDKKVLSYIKDSVNTIKRFDIEPKKEYPNGKYIRFCGDSHILKVYKRKTSHSIGDCSEEAMNTGNVLYNKKIAFCGDSFTEASNLGKPDGYDEYWGCYKSYGWRIANRNKMKLYHDGIGGSTMHIVDVDNPNTNSPFAYQRYKNVPNDCDYIILQFGLNESSIANDDSTKGTKESTDATTMWGSWNTVLEYLITNHPTARIGVVMSDAWMSQTYFTTLKEICEWWGVPLLDLGGDSNVPVMNGGRRAGCGLTLNPKVAELRNATFYNAEGDAHPNDLGHEWRSTVIENFIRSL